MGFRYFDRGAKYLHLLSVLAMDAILHGYTSDQKDTHIDFI